jgi:hypothetical protein
MITLECQGAQETEAAGSEPAPAEALIPEAKRRQRARYRRTGAVAAIVACVVATVVVLALLALWASGGPGRASGLPAPSASPSASVALVRPVLCLAGPATSTSTLTGPLPTSCPPPYAQTPADIGVRPTAVSFSSNPGQNDPALAGYPTTAHDAPGRVVLLATAGRGGQQRYLLGPASLTLSSATVAGARVVHTSDGAWDVDLTLKPAAAARWEGVAAQAFHSLLAIDYRGSVVTAPLIEPMQRSFSSFGSSMELSGDLTRTFSYSFVSALTPRG